MILLEKLLTEQIGIPLPVLPAVMEAIEPLIKEEVIPKGSYLVKEGGTCKKIVLIRAGYIRSFFFNGKKEITQWIHWPGQIASDPISFVFDKASKRNFQALEDCSVFSISRENYQSLSNMFPDWFLYEREFIVKVFTNLEDRIQNLISLNAEERYQHFFEAHPSLFNEVPLAYIASMLNMSRETLSRIRGKVIS